MGKFLAVASFYNNPEQDIDNTFNNVLNQTHKDWLLIVGDDFSTDLELKHKLKRKVEEVNDPRIIYYELKTKRELYLYQNTFIHHKYDYYLDLDTDDVIHNQLFKIYDSHFIAHPEVLSIFCDYHTVESSTNNLQQWSLVQEPENWLEEWNFRNKGEFWDIYSKKNTQKMFGHGRVMRRPETTSLPIAKECKTATDTFFLFYNLSRGKHLHIPRNLYTYKRREGSDSGKLTKQEAEEFNLNSQQFFKNYTNPGKVGIYDNIWHITSAISTCEWINEVNMFTVLSEELSKEQKKKLRTLYPDKTVLFNKNHENVIVAWTEEPSIKLPEYTRLSILTFNDADGTQINATELEAKSNNIIQDVNRWANSNGSWYIFFRQNRLTHNKSTNKVLIVSSATKEVTWNSFGGPEWTTITKPNHKDYADKWGYHYLNTVVDNSIVEDRHPTWVKIYQIIELIKLKKWDWIIWIDSDAVFVNQEQDINNWIAGEWNWVLPKMPPDVESNRVWTKTTTGFMCIRSCDHTLAILEQMWEHPGKYRFDHFHEQTWLDEYFKKLLATNRNLNEYSFEDISEPLVFNKSNKPELLVIPYRYHLIDETADFPFIYHAGGNTPTKFKRIKSVLETAKGANKIYITFEYGPKVEILGDDKKDYFVEFIDSRNNQTIHSDTIQNNTWTKCGKEYFVPWIVKVDGKEIHRFNVKDKTVKISFQSKSVGDTLAWMPQVVEFKNKYKCKVVVSSYHNEWFQGLSVYKDIEFIAPNTPYPAYAHYNVGWFKNNNEWDEGSKNPTQANTIPLIQTATDILGLPYKEVNYGINFTPSERPVQGKYICIGPRSTAGLKEWPHENWRKLAKKLHKDGYKVVNLSYEGFEGTNIINKKKLSWEETWNYLYHADLFIGLGSGLSWANWSLGKHTLMINNFLPLGYEFTKNLTKLEDASVCNNCWIKKEFTFDPGNWDWCPINQGTEKQHICQKTIETDRVYQEVITIVSK